MSNMKAQLTAQTATDNNNSAGNPGNTPLKVIGSVLIAIGVLVVVALVLLLTGPLAGVTHQWLNALLAVDSVEALWYVTRASGIIAFLLLWLSTVWGLAVSNKILSPVLQGIFSFDFHEILSLLAIGFTMLHMGVLLFDAYMPYSLTQILVPFTSTYRSGWIGIGVIGFYLMLLVSVTFYLRRLIGQQTFKALHYLSYASYLGVTLHSIFSGSDTALPATQLMYAGTFLVVVFMTVYHIVLSSKNRRDKKAKTGAASPATLQNPAQSLPRAQQTYIRTIPNGTATRRTR